MSTETMHVDGNDEDSDAAEVMHNEKRVEARRGEHKIIEGNGNEHDMEVSYGTGICMYNDTCMYTDTGTVQSHVFAHGHIQWHGHG